MSNFESSPLEDRVFDCRLYVSRRNSIMLRMPAEKGPVSIARLEALDYDSLIDPTFRRLLAAFESVPQPLFVQV